MPNFIASLEKLNLHCEIRLKCSDFESTAMNASFSANIFVSSGLDFSFVLDSLMAINVSSKDKTLYVKTEYFLFKKINLY